MLVTGIDVVETARGTQIRAKVVWDRAGREPEDLSFLYADVETSAVTTPGDALTAAVLFPAMAHHEDVAIDAPVSSQLLANTREVARIWTTWRPEWRASVVRAAEADRRDGTPTEVSACFSCGLDSWYTVLLPREEPITTLISMHGFQAQESLVGGQDDLMLDIGRAAARLGRKHIVVESNIYRWGLRYLPRTGKRGTVHHGAVLASMALGLGSLVRRCYIASSEPFHDRPWGSHPLVDPLWSTETLDVVHDAAELSRTQKYPLVAQSDIALDSLLVCTAVRDDYRNCRRCDTCVSTAYMLHLAGVLDRCRTLGPVSPQIVARTRIGMWHHRIWENLRDQSDDPAYRRAISAALRRAKARKVLRPLGDVRRRLARR